MNLVQTNLLREVAAEVKAHGGLTQFKAHALKNLELRTVLKESHGSPILDIVFNTLGPEHRNLFASIGKDQVTIYDDEHMGDYLGVVVHYVNAPSEHHKGGDVSCCAWVQMEGASRHELGDACLAVSGPEGVIQVISVAEARVVAMLRDHRCEVVELRGCPGRPGLLLSLGADGGLALWDAVAGTRIAEAPSDALTAELHPEGRCLFTGHKGGRICRWDLDWERPAGQDPAATAAPDTATDAATDVGPSSSAGGGASSSSSCRLALRGGGLSGGPAPQPLPAGPSGPALGDHVDCIRCLPGNRLAAKSADGRLALWRLGGPAGAGASAGGEGGAGAAGVAEAAAAAALTLSLRVPGVHPAAGGSRCRLSAARDGAFLCIANPAGDVFVYDTATGCRAAHYAAGRAAGGSGRSGSAAAAALSEDGRHLLVARGGGYVLRYEYVRRPGSGPGGAEAGAGSDAGPSSREASPDLLREAPGAEAGPADRAAAAPLEAAAAAPGAEAKAATTDGQVANGGRLAGVKRRRASEEGGMGDGGNTGDDGAGGPGDT